MANNEARQDLDRQKMREIGRVLGFFSAYSESQNGIATYHSEYDAASLCDPRVLRHMKPATWSLLGRSQALLGGLPLSTPLIRQRKTMRVTVKSSVRYVPT